MNYVYLRIMKSVQFTSNIIKIVQMMVYFLLVIVFPSLYISSNYKMITTFRTLNFIKKCSNSITNKSKFSINIKRRILLNQEIEACKAQPQLLKIFQENHKIMNTVNLATMFKKATEQKRIKDEKAQDSYLIKALITQVQLRWNHFIEPNDGNFRPLINLMLYLGNNKVNYLNKKFMETDLLNIFQKANQLEKTLLLSGILGLDLQKQLDEKYADQKSEIIKRIYFVQAGLVKEQDLKGQNLMNLLIYTTSMMQSQNFVTLWRYIIGKKLDTKFFNNHMIRLILKSFKTRNQDRNVFRDYVYFLKCISEVIGDLQQIGVKQIIKNYPKKSMNLRNYEISIFYSLVKKLPQLKEVIRQQLKMVRREDANQSTYETYTDQNQPLNYSLVKMVQKQFLRELKSPYINMKGIAITLYEMQSLNQFYLPPLSLLKQVQLVFVKIIKKTDRMPKPQDFFSVLVSMHNFYIAKNVKCSQIQNFYQQIIKFVIKQDLDRIKTELLCQFLYFLSGYRRLQVLQTRKSQRQKNQSEFQLFGLKDELRQKFLSTLKIRNINFKNLCLIIKNFQKIQIANKEVCDFIKNKITMFQSELKDYKDQLMLKQLIKNQKQLSCSMKLKNCLCISQNHKQKLSI